MNTNTNTLKNVEETLFKMILAALMVVGIVSLSQSNDTYNYSEKLVTNTIVNNTTVASVAIDEVNIPKVIIVGKRLPKQS